MISDSLQRASPKSLSDCIVRLHEISNILKRNRAECEFTFARLHSVQYSIRDH